MPMLNRRLQANTVVLKKDRRVLLISVAPFYSSSVPNVPSRPFIKGSHAELLCVERFSVTIEPAFDKGTGKHLQTGAVTT